MKTRSRSAALLASLLLVFTLAAADDADARRGGGFGSRGARTFDTPAVTRTAPADAAPINRTVTQPGAPAANRSGSAAQTSPATGGLFGGLGRGLVGGLVLGGLFGLLMGTGFGGLGGFLALAVQLFVVGLGIWLLMRLFRGRSVGGGAAPVPALARAGSGARPQPARREASSALPGSGAAGAARQPVRRQAKDEIGITPADYDAFEGSLQAVQAAFSREDYAALRRLATPEVMSHLAEELSVNATRGMKNDVSDVTLLQGDLSEAWREGPNDYATVAMRFESVDVMRDRQTGALADGSSEAPSQTTEIWTFTRPRGGEWKLSAIQDA